MYIFIHWFFGIFYWMTSIDFYELYKQEKAKLKKKTKSIFTFQKERILKDYELADCIYYIDDFITESEEKTLIEEIYKQKETW